MQSPIRSSSSSNNNNNTNINNNNKMLHPKSGTFHMLSLLLLISSIDGYYAVEGAQINLINSSQQQAFSEFNPGQPHSEIEPNNQLLDSNQQKQQQDQTIERILNGMPRRYVFAGSAIFLDLDQYGHITRTNQQQQRRVPLNRILESLSYSILPTAAPMTETPTRFGRTYRAESRRLNSDSSRRLQQQQQQQPQQQQPESRVYPIDFSVGVEMPDFIQTKSTSEPRWMSGWVNRFPGAVRRASKDEALRSPMHLRAAADFDGFKRVENSNRWNNLKGMWGKRADLDFQQQQQQRAQASYADNLDQAESSAEKAELGVASEREIIKSM